ncbi:MAG: hypothetical protein KTR30_15980 [Saprospiraceae bacterium]|nr:hypothetical protein [Saprospiraceae bacterium]
MSKTAWEFQHFVECKAAKSFAWAFWTDVSNWERIEGKAVEWIKLHGPFTLGTFGETKMPGQEPQKWRIGQIDLGHSATIEMVIPGALFQNEMILESISPDQTRIVQRMSLTGDKAQDLAEGMRVFETSAPQGLAKLARAIEAANSTS